MLTGIINKVFHLSIFVNSFFQKEKYKLNILYKAIIYSAIINVKYPTGYYFRASRINEC